MQREGYITSSCICTAFNELLNVGVSGKGRFYVAFFQLAIGIERTLKLAIIVDHMVENGLKPPGSRATKEYGHDLCVLHDRAKSIAESRPSTQIISFEQKAVQRRILAFLTEFANSARYSNLDNLASGATRREPFVE
jgi:hypothetical protein